VAIQADAAEGPGRLVRIRLGSGGARATGVELLDSQVETAGTALTISRDAAYYVVRGVSGPVIRRVPLR
jgi:hypothetical protein